MSTSRTPAITIVEPSIREGDDLSRVPTNGSSSTSLSQIEEDREHKQDWTIVTDEKDSWANRERRRSSVWAKLELVPAPTVHSAAATTSPTNKKGSFGSQGAPRRGSILSMWQGGKDKNGKDILVHDDHSEGEDEDVVVGSPKSEEGEKVGVVERERRGSILSIWKKGKDEHGNAVMVHDDEEWKV
ncbi:hypothetical protein V8E51_019458 [Hyaloscypha variabilis]